MKVSGRQAKRIWARYRSRSDAGLLHGNQGRPSNRRIDLAVHEAAIEAYRQYYSDFGPTPAAEKMLERQELKIDHSRGGVGGSGWELVQFDGSAHAWLEGRGHSA